MTINIFVCDDSKNIQAIFHSMAKMLPSKPKIFVASNGYELTDLFNEALPDVIFLDIRMPRMNADEFLQLISMVDTGGLAGRIVLLSGEPLNTIEEIAGRYNIKHWFEKPFTFDQFEKFLNNFLSDQSEGSPKIA